jgi:Protein of unknown function (DUF2958)
MNLFTKEIERKLSDKNLTGQNAQVPICKFFNPTGHGTWLIFARDHDDNDILWGCADIGMQCVEYGTIYLPELLAFRGRLGLKIERDLHFTPKTHPNGDKWQLKDYLKLDTLAGI